MRIYDCVSVVSDIENERMREIEGKRKIEREIYLTK